MHFGVASRTPSDRRARRTPGQWWSTHRQTGSPVTPAQQLDVARPGQGAATGAATAVTHAHQFPVCDDECDGGVSDSADEMEGEEQKPLRLKAAARLLPARSSARVAVLSNHTQAAANLAAVPKTPAQLSDTPAQSVTELDAESHDSPVPAPTVCSFSPGAHAAAAQRADAAAANPALCSSNPSKPACRRRTEADRLALFSWDRRVRASPERSP
jgi:hypothetical protein